MATGAVAAISWRPFAVPFRVPVETASGTWRSRDGFIVRVTTGDGTAALGEASPLPAGPGLPAIEVLLSRLASLSAGRPPQEALEAVRTGSACGPAAFGIEVPLAALAARERGLPLHRWLSGDPTATSATIPVNALVDVTSPSAAAERAAAAVSAGYRTIKLKVGGTAAEDIARIRSVRETVGPGVKLRIDANGGWDIQAATEVLAAASECGVVLCEQPVPPGPDAPAAFAELRELGVSLAADESCRDAAALRPFIAAGAIDAVVIKPMLTGLSQALAMIDVAQGHGLVSIITTTFDAGPGTLAAMHLAGSLPSTRPACGLSTIELLEHPLVAGVPSVHEGEINLSPEPGMPLTLDGAALDRYATGPWVEVRA